MALYEQRADLRLPYDVPPVLAILDHVLDHLVVVALELVVLLVVEQPQGLDAVIYGEHSEILVYLLQYLLDLQYLFDVDLDVLGAGRLV